MVTSRLRRTGRVRLVRTGVLSVTVALAFLHRSAGADLVIGAWFVVLHNAGSKTAARDWATDHCAQVPLNAYCTTPWNDGALGAAAGVFKAADWPGVKGGPWVVGIGPVRSRRVATQVTAALQAGGLDARVVRIPALPRVHLWAADVAGRWRLWSLRGPGTQQDVLYLSREGQPEIELARGWPLPRESGGAELYPIGREPSGKAFYYYHAGSVRRLLPATGVVTPAALADEATAQDARAAADVLLDAPIPTHVEWALPFAAALTVNLDDNGAESFRRRFVLLRRGSGGWRVERDQVQIHAPVAP